MLMKRRKIILGLKYFSVFLLLIFGISVIAFFSQPSETRKNFMEYLGIAPRIKCTGSLSLSTPGINECIVYAKILTFNCIDKTYQVRENSCSGSIKYRDVITYDSFQATCAWSASKGIHKYVLCIDGLPKDSSSIICK